MSVIKIVAYYTDHGHNELEKAVLYQQQKQAVESFLAKKNEEHKVLGPYGHYQAQTWQLLADYFEEVERKTKRFPQFTAALQQCVQQQAELVIPEMQDLVRNENFTSLLLKHKITFYCLDQPSIQKATLPALVETFQKLKMRHSQRIRNALKQTVAKLGNPNALKEITKVNKPKRENAVMFALMLAPIIEYYRKSGYSQRKMVDALNADGYLAPEGGQWVLSQLQKVLERIDFNNCALNLSETLLEFTQKGYSEEQQVKALHAMQARAPGHAHWDLELLRGIKERQTMIEDIMVFNQFVLQVFPQLLDYQENGLSDAEIAERLNKANVAIPERILWELQQALAEEQDSTEITQHWESSKVELAKAVAERREKDIAQLINSNTIEKAQTLIAEQLQDSKG